MNKGVLYLLINNPQSAPRLCVSLWSLRKHYDGPVTIIANEATEDVVRKIADGLDADVKMVEVDQHRKNGHFLDKPKMPEWSPYDQTVFLDCDTLIVAPINDLFVSLDANPLFVTQFSDWRSDGRKIRNRVLGLRKKSPLIDHLVDLQEQKPCAALNTGVVGWNRNAEGVLWWRAIVEALGPIWIADELAMQVVFDLVPHELLGRRYNCSPIYDETEKNPVIWHFHGRKHMRHAKGRAIWLPAFLECEKENAAHIKSWGRGIDKEIDKHEKD